MIITFDTEKMTAEQVEQLFDLARKIALPGTPAADTSRYDWNIGLSVNRDTDAGRNKVSAVKAIRAITGLTLGPCVDAYESGILPAPNLTEDLVNSIAHHLRKEFAAAGMPLTTNCVRK